MRGLVGRVLPARREEALPLLLAAGCYFLLLASYYVLRPIREEIGAAQRDVLPHLQTFTFLGMLVAVPLYSALVARLPRRWFLLATYAFFGTNLLVFYVLRAWFPDERLVWEERVFFVWISVYNLFAVAVFWGLMADLHRSRQAQRLFGLVAVGGSVGALVGSHLTEFVVTRWSLLAVFPVAIGLLAGTCLCAWILARRPPAGERGEPAEERPLGGSVLEGFHAVLRSPYLLGVSLYILLQSLVGTFAYFEMEEIVGREIADPVGRVVLFARMDQIVNTCALVLQLLVVAHVMRRLGLVVALGILPAIGLLGFACLALSPTLPVIVTLMVLLRCSRYGFSKPAREVLYTVVPRTQKYKAKAFVDTVVYRGGDTIWGWSFAGLAKLGLGLAGIAGVAAPLAGAAALVGDRLARRQRSLDEAGGGDS